MIRRLVALLVVAVAVVIAPGGTGSARADDGLDHSCAASLGGTLPVVFVHGWRSNGHAWDAAEKALISPSITPVTFDYEKQHTNWVTDPHIGPALARLIVCLGRNSEIAGGPGKVLVVGHSMGGLAIRCALQVSCSQVVGASAFVAQVITIGTPTHGSFLRYGGTIGNAARMALDLVCETVRTAATRRVAGDAAEQQELCQALLSNDAAVAFNDDSAELRALRADSTSTPVLAIAGDIKLDVGVLFGQYTIAHGDAVVDQRSQQSWSTATGDVDCGRLVLGASVTQFGYAIHGGVDTLTYATCWHGSETQNPDAIRLIRAKVTAVNARLPRPDRRVIRFDGIGDVTLGETVPTLRTHGFVNVGNVYEGMTAACVTYARTGFPLSVAVDTLTGRVIAIHPSNDPNAYTQVGHITVGSSLAQVRAAFGRAGYRVVEKLQGDFGQGSNGVVVDGPGGSIGLGLESTSAAAYADGSATVDWIAGVGRPGNAPSRMETGC